MKIIIYSNVLDIYSNTRMVLINTTVEKDTSIAIT